MKTEVTSSTSRAARAIRQGQVVAFPTETVYGLGADAFNPAAVRKIFRAKRRPADNPLIVHIHSISQLRQVASEVPPLAKRLITEFFPGPLTLVLRKSPAVPSVVTARLDTVCVRMPSPAMTREFLRECGVPVAAPSANISGGPSPTSWRHVLSDLRGRVPLVLKGPDSYFGLESTILDCTRTPPVLLRPGAVSVEELERVAGKIAFPRGKGRPKSPGMKHRHYAPRARVVPFERGKMTDFQADAAIIALAPSPFGESKSLHIIVDGCEEYARRLYSFFRECDAWKINLIYAELPSKNGIGLALRDRILRAASR